MKMAVRYAGVVCIPVYVVFTFVSHLFNTEINPMSNWLSDFGNPLKNPSGALFYNMGCITAAFNIVSTNAFSSFYIAQWIYILLFMIYVAAVTINNNKITATQQAVYLCDPGIKSQK